MLFSFARGLVIKGLSKIQLINLGREIARFHNVSSGITNSNVRWDFDIETTINTPLKLLKSGFRDNPEDYTWLLKMSEEVTMKISPLHTAHFPQGYCHFDLLPKNFHFDDDQITLFDFDFMGYGWLVNDIMTFWQHLMLEVYTNRMTQEAADDAFNTMLKGYLQYRHIGEQELAMIPYLSFGFWLFYMGFHTTHDQFIVFSQPSHLKSYVGILRHIAATYWN